MVSAICFGEPVGPQVDHGRRNIAPGGTRVTGSWQMTVLQPYKHDMQAEGRTHGNLEGSQD